MTPYYVLPAALSRKRHALKRVKNRENLYSAKKEWKKSVKKC